MEEFVRQRRADVLSRAIGSLENSSPGELQAITHRIAGALSLYSFAEEGNQARAFSGWLAENQLADDSEITRRRDELLRLLKDAFIV